ncbi:hypothetical protein GIB67_025034, partial [Kingdonia uniflora]
VNQFNLAETHFTAIQHPIYLITVAYCYNIALQVYTLSRGLLIESINSTWPRHAIQLFKIQYFSLHSLIDSFNLTFN